MGALVARLLHKILMACATHAPRNMLFAAAMYALNDRWTRCVSSCLHVRACVCVCVCRFPHRSCA